jgi:hypothetical protein
LVFSGEDLATRLMNESDPPLLDLVKTRVNSLINRDLCCFLRENPNTAAATVDSARSVDRKVATAELKLCEPVPSTALSLHLPERYQ